MKTGRRSATGIIVGGILLVTGTSLVWQGRLISQLRRENRTLREETEEKAAISNAANSRAAADEEVRRLRAEVQEVHKLRNEVSQLRAQKNELERVRAENQRLKTAPQLRDTSAAQAGQAQDYFAKQDWTFAGYATPEAALQSSLWAMREGDLRTLQASTTAEGWARIAGEQSNGAEARIAEEIQRKVRDSGGFRVLDRKALADDEILLRVHADGETADQNIVVKRVAGEWKVERSYRDPPVPPAQSP